MSSNKLVAAGVGAATLPLILFAVWQLGPIVIEAAGFGAEDSIPQGRTVGERRIALLRKLTRQYVAHSEDVAPAVAAGKRLAPPSYLNERLIERDAKWRVRSVEGLEAETYLVS